MFNHNITHRFHSSDLSAYLIKYKYRCASSGPPVLHYCIAGNFGEYLIWQMALS